MRQNHIELKFADIVFFDASEKSKKEQLVKLLVGDPIHVGIIFTTKPLKILHASKQKQEIIVEPIENFNEYKLSIYRIKPRYADRLDEKKLFVEALEFIGKKYGTYTWLTAVLSYCVKLPPHTFGHGDFDKYNPHCSALVSRLYRIAGIDLRPDLADVLTTPKDLIRSNFIHHIYTVEGSSI
ncbi:MAG: hypothetical protein QXW98_04235 [Candidatus Caldarchaeum sp.]